MEKTCNFAIIQTPTRIFFIERCSESFTCTCKTEEEIGEIIGRMHGGTRQEPYYCSEDTEERDCVIIDLKSFKCSKV